MALREDAPVQGFGRRGSPVVHQLDESECWRLLELAPLGRVGLTDGALPAIMPVHFTRWHGEVVFASLPDVKIHSAELAETRRPSISRAASAICSIE